MTRQGARDYCPLEIYLRRLPIAAASRAFINRCVESGKLEQIWTPLVQSPDMRVALSIFCLTRH